MGEGPKLHDLSKLKPRTREHTRLKVDNHRRLQRYIAKGGDGSPMSRHEAAKVARAAQDRLKEVRKLRGKAA